MVSRAPAAPATNRRVLPNVARPAARPVVTARPTMTTTARPLTATASPTSTTPPVPRPAATPPPSTPLSELDRLSLDCYNELKSVRQNIMSTYNITHPISVIADTNLKHIVKYSIFFLKKDKCFNLIF